MRTSWSAGAVWASAAPLMAGRVAAPRITAAMGFAKRRKRPAAKWARVAVVAPALFWVAACFGGPVGARGSRRASLLLLETGNFEASPGWVES